MSQPNGPARSYNHLHTARKYTAGKRRFSVYWTWSYPWEANRDTTELDNRFSTMTEVRRVAWPAYETVEFSQKMFLQGIAGTLELFHLSIVRFQEVVGSCHRVSGRSLSADRSGRPEIAAGRAHPRRHRHADGLRPGSPAHRTGGLARKRSRRSGIFCAAKEPVSSLDLTMMSAVPPI